MEGAGSEGRKQAEADFHDYIRGDGVSNEAARSNKIWYSVNRATEAHMVDWLAQRCRGRRVLDFCTGNGDWARRAASLGASEVIGVDISPVSVDNASALAEKEGLANCRFVVGDAESLDFEDASFDIVMESGALHHVDLAGAFSEIARVLRPSGAAICDEALVHNPLFQLYRRRTPQLRTEFEADHILSVADIKSSRRWFDRVDITYLHLLSLLAVPLRDKPSFPRVLGALEAADSVLLRVPGVQRLAWQAIFTLEAPRSL